MSQEQARASLSSPSTLAKIITNSLDYCQIALTLFSASRKMLLNSVSTIHLFLHLFLHFISSPNFMLPPLPPRKRKRRKETMEIVFFFCRETKKKRSFGLTCTLNGLKTRQTEESDESNGRLFQALEKELFWDERIKLSRALMHIHSNR